MKKFNKDMTNYVDDGEGLGLLPVADRMALRDEVLLARYADWRSVGMSDKEAMRRALMGDCGHFPSYEHRSAGQLDDYPSLDPAPAFEFRRDYDVDNAEAIIEEYLSNV